MPWLLRWAAMSSSRFEVGHDGKTAYERLKGKKCKTEACCLGESVWYKELKDNRKPDNKMVSDWHEGVWLGPCTKSTETLIGTPAGVVRAWTIRRRPVEHQWNGDMIMAVKGTPARPVPGKSGEHIPIRVRFDDVDEPET